MHGGIHVWDMYAYDERIFQLTHEPDLFTKFGRIRFNKIRYQLERRDISTCARHVAMRLKFIEMEDGTYAKFMNSCKSLNLNNWDEFVTIATLSAAPLKTIDIDYIQLIFHRF